MLYTAKVLNKKVPAITHIDNSSRIQTVIKNDGYFYNVIFNYFKLTGIPVLLNTSFNKAGESIVETSDDAIKSFLNMDLDILYLNTYSCLYRVTKKSIYK